MQITEAKNSLRKAFGKIRGQINTEQKTAFDRCILSNVIKLSLYREAEIIFTYVSVGTETDTINIINKALSDKKNVAVPRCADRFGNMDFYFIKSLDDLETGKFNIPEPRLDICERVSDLSRGLCIVPGLAFDRYGFRLGYGKGFYDRFLSVFGGNTIGICYSCCIGHDLPRNEFDMTVGAVVTENSIITIKHIGV